MNIHSSSKRPAFVRTSIVTGLMVGGWLAASPSPVAQAPYYPPAGQWARKAPGEAGMDAAKLDAAITFAKSRETNWPRDFSTQEKIFGSLLGPIPNSRAATNGLVIRHGYVVAEFGDT